jgi:predicted alpha/beta-hydrolase family hydrolase
MSKSGCENTLELRSTQRLTAPFVDKDGVAGQNEKASLRVISIVLHAPHLCPNGGIGRRARFRTWFSQGSGGSSPLSGTKLNSHQILILRAMNPMHDVRNLRFSVLDNEEVSALLLLPPHATCLLVLAHGAGAGMNHTFMSATANQLADDNVATLRYQFPYMEQRRGVPDKQPLLTATVAAAVATATRLAPDLLLFAGGKSMGGRMTSIAASEQKLEGVRGLIFFGFPLHPPKRPSIKRAEHLQLVKMPMLFLQGTRDDLADLTLLRPICEGLGPQITLHVIESADHSFHVLKRSGQTDPEVLAELSSTVKTWTSRRAAGAKK